MKASNEKIYFKVILTLFIIVFLCLPNVALKASPFKSIEITDSLTISNITGSTYFFKDSSRNITINYFNQELDSCHFPKANWPQTNFGQTKSYYWFLIPLKNSSSGEKQIILELDNPNITQVEFFEQNASGSFNSQGLLGCYPNLFYARPIKYRNFIFSVTLKPNEQKRCLLFIDKSFRQLSVILKMYEIRTFFQSAINNYMLLGIYAGALMVIIIFNFIMFLCTKTRIIFFYGCFFLFSGLYVIADWGIGYQYLWFWFPKFTYVARPFFSIATIIMAGLCVKLPLQNILYRKLINIIVYTAIVIILFCAFTILFSNPGNSTFMRNTWLPYLVMYGTFIIFSFALLMFILIRESILGNKTMQVILLIYSFSCILVLLKQINMFGIISGSDFLDKGMIYGHMTEFVSISILLSIYYQRLKEKNDKLLIEIKEQQQKYINEVVNIQETERKHIAENLHDGLGGALSAIKVNLSSWLYKNQSQGQDNKLLQIESMVDNACAQVRTIAHDLMPPELVKLGFNYAIESLVYNMGQNGKVNIHLSNELAEKQLKPEIEIAVYRIINELLTNTLRHSKAQNASLQLFVSEGILTVIAEDNGIGFDTNAMVAGMGLGNIKSRVAALNGSITIDSAPNKGSSFLIEIPIKGD